MTLAGRRLTSTAAIYPGDFSASLTEETLEHAEACVARLMFKNNNKEAETVEASTPQTVTTLFPDEQKRIKCPDSVFVPLSKHLIHHGRKQPRTAGKFVFLSPRRDVG